MPKGGGAIRATAESFSANPATGAGAMSIPIGLSPGRSGFGPKLSSTYASSGGNGPLGFGWSLAAGSIRRKTSRGLPRYDGTDVFKMGGAEDLVPADAPPERRECHEVRRYLPRIEGSFARIEQWRHLGTGVVHWRTITRANVTTVFGMDLEARVADPDDPARVFEWLVSESHDDKGNLIRYRYVAEDGRGVDTETPGERARRRGAVRYLKSIHWGNRVSRLVDHDRAREDWLFSAVLDYGEGHVADLPGDPDDPVDARHARVRVSYAPQRAWAARPDPFSTYRAGFELRRHRRCERILMFHHFEELGDGPCLVSATEFEYDDFAGSTETAAPEREHQGSSRYASFLRRARRTGYVRNDPECDIYMRRSAPPVEFDYSRPVLGDQARSLSDMALENLPQGVDGTDYQWVDLDGDGLPGILSRQNGAWYFKANLGAGRFGAVRKVSPAPALALGVQGRENFMDLSGDGQLDVAVMDGPTPGFYERRTDDAWTTFRHFRSRPEIDFADPNLRYVDLSGDGLADILIVGDEVFTWHPSEGEAGFGPAARTHPPWDETEGPRIVFADGEGAVHLADMTGDGLSDLVQVRNGRVAFWPNLGYGRFGARVVMADSPWFDTPDLFDPRRVRLGDIDGSGTKDILYLGRDGVRLFFNLSGNGWSAGETLRSLPPVDATSVVTVADILGTGTASLVWSTPLRSGALGPIRYVELMRAGKPHLLTATRNNRGLETRIDYSPSTRFFLEDRARGRHWVTRLPFPVHVVTRTEATDRVARTRFVSRFGYHHGHYDGHEREFAGFAQVDQRDTDELAALSAGGELGPPANVDAASYTPPVLTRRWYHTGAHLDAGRISAYFAGRLGRDGGEYFREPGLAGAEVQALLLPDGTLPEGLDADEMREASRALRGVLLREEVYAEDGTGAEALPYLVAERRQEVQCVQRRGGNRYGVFLALDAETLTFTYDRQQVFVRDGTIVSAVDATRDRRCQLRMDPRVAHSLTLEFDRFGTPLKRVAIGYPRRFDDPDAPEPARLTQCDTRITLEEAEVTNEVDRPDARRTPATWQTTVWELTGYVPSGPMGLFRAEDFARLAGERVEILHDRDIGFEDAPGPGRVRRLLSRGRTLFRRDDLDGSLPPGSQETLGIIHETLSIVMTDAMVAQVFGDRIEAETVARETALVRAERLAGDPEGTWWRPSGRRFLSPAAAGTSAEERAHARAHFHLPQRFRDPFHRADRSTESEIRYDRYDLLVAESEDALGNRVTVGERAPDPAAPLLAPGHDYRVLQPARITDENRNLTEVAFDAFGLPTAIARAGKTGLVPPEGERLSPGLKTDLTDAEIDRLFDDPAGPFAREILGSATARSIADPRSVPPDGARPRAELALAREHHGPAPGRIATQLVHFDGAGNALQTKELAALPEAAGMPARWTCSGWTVQDNKGRPVRQYEPFFTETHRLEFAVRRGVSPIALYDAPGRAIATVMPDHTWSKTVQTPWRAESWDAGDTVLIADPLSDPDAGWAISRLPEADVLPTWHTARIDGALGPEAATAARQSEICAATPSIAHTDSLGRTVATLTLNRIRTAEGTEDRRLTASAEIDIQGHPLRVTDALGRVAMDYVYDMAGRRLRQRSNEAGARLTLSDAAGNPVRSWDDRGHRRRMTYDALRRPTGVHLSEAGGAEVQISASIHGEGAAEAEARNLRGRIAETRDQSGSVLAEAFDFKGNLLVSSRRITVAFEERVDWSGEVALEEERHVTRARYDALDRPVQTLPPHPAGGRHHHVVQPRYDHLGLVVGIDTWHDRAHPPEDLLDPSREPPSEAGIAEIRYDARRRRTAKRHVNRVETRYNYDPRTFRLVRLVTTRGSERLQDLAYTHDATGHVTHMADASVQPLFFRNEAVTADQGFEHDARGQLTAATGRIHLGQGGGPVSHGPEGPAAGLLPHPGDGAALARYRESYAYDDAGNIVEMRQRVPSRPGANWMRHYVYDEPGALTPESPSNRLSATHLGDVAEPVAGYDAHGSMLGLPHLADMAWDHADRLKMTRRTEGAAGERTWYVYDGSGERVRKVTTDAEGRIRHERLYLSGGVEIFRRHGARPLARETLHVGDGAERCAMVETRLSGEEPKRPRRRVCVQVGTHQGSVSLELDGAARILSVQEFSPYGSRTYLAVANDLEAPRYAYTGQELDGETGFQRHGLRYYAPWLGRWASADPEGPVDGPNLYQYASNAPTSAVDPSGTQSIWDDLADLYSEAINAVLGPDDPVVSSTPRRKVSKSKARSQGNTDAARVRRQQGMTDPEVQAGHLQAARHTPESGAPRAQVGDPANFQHLHSRRNKGLDVTVTEPSGRERTTTRHRAQEGLIDDSISRSRAGGRLTPEGQAAAGEEVRWRTEGTGLDQREVAEGRSSGFFSSARDADIDINGRVVPGANTTRALESRAARLGKTAKKFGLVGKALAVGIAAYVFFDTGSAYAAAQTANPLANATDAALADDAPASSVSGGLAKDVFETVTFGIGLLLLPQGDNIYDQELADRAIAEGRNPFCAQCHGPGGALDPDNEWNRRNRFPDLNDHTPLMDQSQLRQWLESGQ